MRCCELFQWLMLEFGHFGVKPHISFIFFAFSRQTEPLLSLGLSSRYRRYRLAYRTALLNTTITGTKLIQPVYFWQTKDTITQHFRLEGKLIIYVHLRVTCSHNSIVIDVTTCRFFPFQISFFLSSYIVPLTLISILYVGMLIRLWHSVPGSKVSAESRRGKKRVTRMVVFVVLGTSSHKFFVIVESFIQLPSFLPKQTQAFAICWLPVHVS